jgi:hypothetical protein
MRPLLSRLIIVMLTAGTGVTAHADSSSGNHNRYKWHDASGSLHYADVLPAEAAKYGYEVVNSQGIVIKRIDRAKTAAELATAKAAAATAQVEKNQADARTRADDQLISGYPEETDLKHAQQQKLEMLDQQIIAAQISLRSQEQVLADLLGRAAEEERNKKTLSEAQSRQLANMRKQVDDQRLAVERRQSERDNATSTFEAETGRYRELKAKRAAQQDGQ